ncbi:ATP-binding protein [Pontibacter harenae]|uniref:ATP-binding protein n=1 Tax=Pontibacter harenae TaxID=2894083 RepID=UPI001E54766D|nr:ATP-binding protein [Pontibacter harenae]MCC9165600.1 GAF domain-containing protein [Pontibacter harenae]
MQNYKNLTVDLSNCDKEPIHIIGRIQPHGFMMILSSADLTVEQVSKNIGEYLEITPQGLIGHTPQLLCKQEEYKTLERQLKNAELHNPQLLVLQSKCFFGFVHASGNKLVVECETYVQVSDHQRFERSYRYSQFQTSLSEQDTLQKQANLVADFVQQILDYDRVMVYQYDQDWNGEVIAESKKPGIRSFLHHHFPASDIPAPARALLLQKHIRQIPDVLASAVDIAPYVNTATGNPTNILQSELRNPSEIHLEYLRNMNVMATLSFSIIVKGKLWGLITCHHHSPKLTNFWIRQTCGMAAKAFANAIPASQEKRDMQALHQYKKVEEELVNQVIESGNVIDGLIGQKCSLLDVTASNGAAIILQDKITCIGRTPEEHHIIELIEWLVEHNNDRIFFTRCLSEVIPQAAIYQPIASGLMALEISRYNKEYILFFKEELKETRVWAGNPEKTFSGEDKLIHPRKSFSKWEEVVKGKSEPWAVHEIEVAQILLKDIIAILLRNQASKLKELNKELHVSADELRRQNDKLKDFAHIISHNLRSPISNIRGLHAMYEAEPNEETRTEVMQMIAVVTGNMSATIDDLNTILRTSINHTNTTEVVDLEEVIEKEKQNLNATLKETQAVIQTDLQVNEILLPKVYVESIFHNLLSNALKYRSETGKPIIEIKTWADEENFYLTVKDNGLGMDLEKVGNKLFGLYKTFHRNKDSKGLGLYLTKTQIESLGGKIEVESEPNKGATFMVKFSRI